MVREIVDVEGDASRRALKWPWTILKLEANSNKKLFGNHIFAEAWQKVRSKRIG